MNKWIFIGAIVVLMAHQVNNSHKVLKIYCLIFLNFPSTGRFSKPSSNAVVEGNATFPICLPNTCHTNDRSISPNYRFLNRRLHDTVNYNCSLVCRASRCNPGEINLIQNNFNRFQMLIFYKLVFGCYWLQYP
jgi:hypothetical protein